MQPLEAPASKITRHAEETVVRTLKPQLRRKIARWFPKFRRGSIQVDDLLQIAMIEAVTATRSWDPARGQSLERWIVRDAYCRCRGFIDRQAGDVRVSECGRRGRNKHAKWDGVELSFIDNEPAAGEPTAEDQLAEAQLKYRARKFVNQLPKDQREVLCEHYGIGRPRRSDRELEYWHGVPRARLYQLRLEALAELRRLLGE